MPLNVIRTPKFRREEDGTGVTNAVVNLAWDFNILKIDYCLIAIQNCDQILELAHGQIVAKGT